MTAGVIQKENLKAVMDAYRERAGVSGDVSLVQLPDKIRAIPAGATYDLSKRFCESAAGQPEASIIIEDGTTSIGEYKFAFFGGKSVKMPATITAIGGNAFMNTQYLTDLNISDLTALATIGTNAFNQSKAINSDTVLEMPSVRNIGSSAFANTSANTLKFPNAGVGNYAFSYCMVKHLETGYASSNMCANCQELIDAKVNLASSLYSKTFGSCTKLQQVILGSPLATINADGFNGDAALAKLVLKNPNGVSLANVSAFTGTPFASTSTAETPTLYVPQALIDSQYYETATNWASLRFNLAPIEGSEYDD